MRMTMCMYFSYISLSFVHNNSLITFTYFLTPRPGGGAVENVGARRGTDGTHPPRRRAARRPPRPPRGAGARPTEVRDRGGMHLNTVFSNETAPALSPRGGGRCYGPDA